MAKKFADPANHPREFQALTHPANALGIVGTACMLLKPFSRAFKYLDNLDMLVVVPRTHTSYCGLKDHADVIKAGLEDLGLDVEIRMWRPKSLILRNTPILLEFTPLAYSRFGLSWPLLLEVLRWRLNGCRVITYFHELPFPNGTGIKKQLAVYLQHAYCSLLAAASAHSLVNQQQGWRWLRLLCSSKRLSFLPTCSNVGESDWVLAPGNRSLQVVVFGSPGKRRHAHALVASLGGYWRLFGPQVQVIDIGEPLDLPSELVLEVKILGSLPSAEIHGHLLASRFGFFYAEPNQFSKSGVYAAYCAHGVIPIISHGAPGHPSCYLTPEDIARHSQRFLNPEAVWRSSRQWYKQFSASVAAKTICELVRVS